MNTRSNNTLKKLTVVVMSAVLALILAACGSVQSPISTAGKPVALAAQFDCTGSSEGIHTGFAEAVREAVVFAGKTPGSSVKAGVITGNTYADNLWAVDESFAADESLKSDRLVQDDIDRRAAAAARRAVPKLIAACQSPDRSRTGSDILGAAVVAADALRSAASPVVPLYVIASDLRQNLSGDWFNTSHPGADDDPEQITSRLKSEGRLPAFPKGTRVVVVGGGRGEGLTIAQALKIRRIWTSILDASGARVVAWGPDFTDPGV